MHCPGVRHDREFLKRAPHCLEGSSGVNVVPQLDKQKDDFVFVKRHYSAFFGTDLDLTLRDNLIVVLIVDKVSATAMTLSLAASKIDDTDYGRWLADNIEKL